jgi:hypothetical protein
MQLVIVLEKKGALKITFFDALEKQKGTSYFYI